MSHACPSTAGLLALALLLASIGGQAQEGGLLANPGFEEDTGNVGHPDGWIVGPKAVVRSVTGQAAEGARSLMATDGYGVAQQELQLPHLTGRLVRVALEARGGDGALMGVRIGFYRGADKKRWQDVPLFWDRPLTGAFETFQRTYKIPDDALPGRFWFCLYRSNQTGTVWFDNVRLHVTAGLDDAAELRLVELSRDAGYLLSRLDAAVKAGLADTAGAPWRERAAAIRDRADRGDGALLTAEPQPEAVLNADTAALFRSLAQGRSLLAAIVPPFERLAPDAVPPLAASTAQLVALRAERAWFGLDVAGAGSGPVRCRLRLAGLPAGGEVVWRRQVFTTTWYTKGRTLVADPVVRLPGGAEAELSLAPGELARLLVTVAVPADAPAGEQALTVEIAPASGAPVRLPLKLTILPKAAPPARMAHYAFLYPTHPVVGNHGREAVADLVAHGVTDVEWPFLPPAEFGPNGELLKVDWSAYDRWLESFGPSPIRLNTFWAPSYDRLGGPDGTPFEVLSEPWGNALVNLLKAWLTHAAEQGVTADRITLLAVDEVHSESLEAAPDAAVRRYAEIARLLRSRIPGLRNYQTFGNYTFPADAAAMLDQIDVALPHLPLPERLSRLAPPDYNPATAFREQVQPLLEKARRERGLEIWSYHVAAGRSDDVLLWNRAYPALAAAAGRTGVAWWAYNVAHGKTWDDTDGRLLDYTFVYDGTEDHPLCHRWNVTGEVVVPSLRWEAVRAGLQEANLILTLQAAAHQPAAAEVLAAARAHAAAMSPGGPQLTDSVMSDLGHRLRAAYGGVRP